MSRSFGQRRRERRDRLIERVQFLVNKMCRADISDSARAHATMERSALMWAIEELDRLDAIAEALATESSEGAAIDKITAIIESREYPTEDDRARTPQLARGWE